MNTFFFELWTRFRSATPKFFKTIRRVSLFLSGLAATATPEIQRLIVSITGLGLDVPTWVNTAATYVTVAGLVAGFVATLTKDDSQP